MRALILQIAHLFLLASTKTDELRRQIELSEAKHVVTTPEFIASVQEAVKDTDTVSFCAIVTSTLLLTKSLSKSGFFFFFCMGRGRENGYDEALSS